MNMRVITYNLQLFCWCSHPPVPRVKTQPHPFKWDFRCPSGPGLGYDSQRRQRYQFLLMVALSSTVFGAFNFRGLAVVSGIWKGRTVKDGQRAWVKNWFPHIFDMTKVKRKHFAKNGYWMDGFFNEWFWLGRTCALKSLTEGAGNQQSPTFPPKSSHEACLVLVLLVFIRLLWLRTLVASPTNQILEFFSPGTKKKPRCWRFDGLALGNSGNFRGAYTLDCFDYCDWKSCQESWMQK